jgi:hypothetical protein
LHENATSTSAPQPEQYAEEPIREDAASQGLPELAFDAARHRSRFVLACGAEERIEIRSHDVVEDRGLGTMADVLAAFRAAADRA